MAKPESIVDQISESVAESVASRIGLKPSTIEGSLEALLDIKNLLSKMIDPSKTVQQDQKFPFVFSKTFEKVLSNLKDTSTNFKTFSKDPNKRDSNVFFDAVSKIPSKIEEKISNKVKDVAYSFVPKAIKSKVLSFTGVEQEEKPEKEPVKDSSADIKVADQKQTEAVKPTEITVDSAIPSLISKGFESVIEAINNKSIEIEPIEAKPLEVKPEVKAKEDKTETQKSSTTENKFVLFSNSVNKHFNQIEKTLTDVKKILTETNVSLNSQPSELEKLATVQPVEIDSFNKQALNQLGDILSNILPKAFAKPLKAISDSTKGATSTGSWEGLIDTVLGTSGVIGAKSALSSLWKKLTGKKTAEEAAKAVEKKGVEAVEKKGVEAVEKKGVEAVEKKGVEAVEKKGVEAVEKQVIKSAEKGLISQIATKAAAAAKPTNLLKGGANILKGGAVGLGTEMALEAAVPEANKDTYLGQVLNEFRSFGISTASGAAGGAASSGGAGAIPGAIAGASIDVGSKLYGAGTGLYDISKSGMDTAKQNKDIDSQQQALAEKYGYNTWEELIKAEQSGDFKKKILEQKSKLKQPVAPEILPKPIKNEIEKPTQWTKIGQPTDVATQLIKVENPGNFISNQPSSFDNQVKDFNLTKGIDLKPTELLSNPKTDTANLYDNMKESVSKADQTKTIQSGTTENKLKDTIKSAESNINNEALKQTATESTKQTQLLSTLVGNMNENFSRIASAFREAGINFKEVKAPVVVQQNTKTKSDQLPDAEIAKQSTSPVSGYRGYANFAEPQYV